VVSTIGFSAGALGIGAGVALLVLSSHRESGSSLEAVRLYPLLGPGLVGAAGSF
jgi:hypothetical protein